MIAAVLAVAANYGSKRDNEAGQAVRSIAANAIEALNFITTVNSKYDVTGESPRASIHHASVVGTVFDGWHLRPCDKATRKGVLLMPADTAHVTKNKHIVRRESLPT